MRVIPSMVAAVLLVAGAEAAALAAETSSTARFTGKLAAYLKERETEFGQIPQARKEDLKQIARFVGEHVKAGRPARLLFICTHNSRRSHMSQIWASEAAVYYGVPKVECFSGGTDGTAFNPRAVAALERAGVEIKKTTPAANPKYLIGRGEGLAPLVSFSKKFTDASNPTSDFCAVMTCTDADQACAAIPGAALRVAIPFEDPKKSDGTPQEQATYDERCAQICREMMYLFSQSSSRKAKPALTRSPH